MQKFKKSEAFDRSFKTHKEQIKLLESRGMIIDDEEYALRTLRSINYYRLSGYWSLFLSIDDDTQEVLDTFNPGTCFSDVMAIYLFDERLRAATFASLVPIELWLRTSLGYELAKLNPYIHLYPGQLGVEAYDFNRGKPSSDYRGWFNKYNRESKYFRLQFSKENKQKYTGELPIWAAVEVLDWGGLSGLYRLSPFKVQKALSDALGVNPTIFNSWLQSLRTLRNYSCHHVRLFNRTFEDELLLPSSSRISAFDGVVDTKQRTFAALSVILYMLDRLNIGDKDILIRCIKSYPQVQLVPIRHLGAPSDWENMELWQNEYNSDKN